MPRFFVDPSDVRDGLIVLKNENARHISLSLRLAVGDEVTVCDGSRLYDCVLVRFDGVTVDAEIRETRPVDTEPPYVAHLYQALPKGDKLDTVIQKAVECGVSEIVPFESSRCIVRMKPEAESKKTERRARIAEEAAKQCGRGVIPSVRATVSFARAMDMAAEADIVLFCYEGDATRPLGDILRAHPTLCKGRRPHVAIVIGSEGGFSPDEARAAADRGFAMTGLGKRILRTETASSFVLAALCLQYEL